MQDNVESIDMDLSDDDVQQTVNENIKVLVDATHEEQSDLMPPPPFPDLSDDTDANNLLDDLNNDLMSGEFNEGQQQQQEEYAASWMAPTHPPPHAANWQEEYNNGVVFRGRGNVKRAGNRGQMRGGFDFRGRGRGYPPPFRGSPRGGGMMMMRGNNRGFVNRGRGRGGGFRGNFRGSF